MTWMYVINQDDAWLIKTIDFHLLCIQGLSQPQLDYYDPKF